MNMKNNNVSEIRKFMSLMESVEDMISKSSIEESTINEGLGTFEDALKALVGIAKEEPGLWNTIKQEVPLIGNRFKNIEELESAMNAGTLKASESAGIVKFIAKNSPEVLSKMLLGLKSEPKFIEMAKEVYPKGTQMAADSGAMDIAKKTLTQMGVPEQEVEGMLKDAAQKSSGTAQTTTKSVDDAIKRRGNVKGNEVQPLWKRVDNLEDAVKSLQQDKLVVRKMGAEGATLASAWEKAGYRIGKYSAKTWQKLKNLRGKISLRNLILYGMAGYGTFELVKNLFKGNPERYQVMPDCIMNTEGIDLDVTSDGSPMVFLKGDFDEKSKGHEGLKFYSNNRVWTIDNAMSGTYSCKGSTVNVGSDESLTETSLNEQKNNISINWDESNGTQTSGGGQTTTTGGGQTSSTPKSKYTACSDFPMNMYCKSDKIKEIQSHLGMPGKYQTGNFGPITSGYLTKNGYNGKTITLDDYNKIIGSTQTSQTREKTDIESLPTGDLKQFPTNNEPEKFSPTEKRADSENKGQDIFNKLRDSGDLWYASGKWRLSKGYELNDTDATNLRNYMATLGFSDKEKEKRYGTKRVFK